MVRRKTDIKDYLKVPPVLMGIIGKLYRGYTIPNPSPCHSPLNFFLYNGYNVITLTQSSMSIKNEM